MIIDYRIVHCSRYRRPVLQIRSRLLSPAWLEWDRIPRTGDNADCPSLNLSDLDHQVHRDVDTLREIVAGLDRLEGQLTHAQATIRARTRGYFTPDEDDRVRQLLLGYRNYRRALYEIIDHYRNHAELGDASLQSRRFLVAFAAALVLYTRSLKLIRHYEHEELIRQKLNEADAKFDLEEGFFDRIVDAFTSFANYRLITGGDREWRTQRREIRRQNLDHSPEIAWLCEVVRRQRRNLRMSFWRVLLGRLRYDWRTLWRTTRQPVKEARYALQSLLGGAFAGLRTTTHYEPALDKKVFEKLRKLLKPGDVLLVRAEQKVTTALLPGFWAHAALYLGSPEELTSLGLGDLPDVRALRATHSREPAPFGHVLEAISPRVLINPLEKCLYADHVAVFRPNVSPLQLCESLTEAFGHLGKPYDFEFDFNVTTRIVCTELVYRSYHRRAGIEFQLIKRLGRYTLSCDDIVTQFLAAYDAPAQVEDPPFRLLSMALRMPDGQCEWFDQDEAIVNLRRIQSGWRPAAAKTSTPPSGTHG